MSSITDKTILMILTIIVINMGLIQAYGHILFRPKQGWKGQVHTAIRFLLADDIGVSTYTSHVDLSYDILKR